MNEEPDDDPEPVDFDEEFEFIAQGDSHRNFSIFEGIHDLFNNAIIESGIDLPFISGPLTRMEVDAILVAHDIVKTLLPRKLKSGNYQRRVVNFYTCATAFIAMKIRDQQIFEQTRDGVARCRELMEMLARDKLMTKEMRVESLVEIREAAKEWLADLRKPEPKEPFDFDVQPEKYRDRVDTEESPGGFFERVYRPYVSQGLLQHQIRLVDPNYYDILHVWCSKHDLNLRLLFAHERPDLLTQEQRARRDRKSATPAP